jgi:hypothetical protein
MARLAKGVIVVNPTIKAQLESVGDALIPNVRNSKGIKLDPTSLLSAGNRKVNFSRLETLVGKSIVFAI